MVAQTTRAPNAVTAVGSPRRSLIYSIPFFGVHIAAVVAVCVMGFSWRGLALALALYVARMFVLTGGYHRYFSHRSYKTSRVFQFILAFLGGTCMQKGALWWAARHRHHHKYSDMPQDVHSALQRGFWWSHVGWIFGDDFSDDDLERVPDLARYPELVWLDRHTVVPIVFYVGLLLLTGGMFAITWGVFVSTVLLWHGTFVINSLAHKIGRKRYVTTDESRNSLGLALITLGEGWHNNHHHYQSSVNQGFYWWEIDITYYGLRLLSLFGLVWDLRKPPRETRDSWRDLVAAPATASATIPAPASATASVTATASLADAK
jgi:stearoyl-CoA desaturase (delta-9 desaturase)